MAKPGYIRDDCAFGWLQQHGAFLNLGWRGEKAIMAAMQQLHPTGGFSPDWNPWKITCFIHCMSYKVGAPKVANAKDDLVHIWVYWLTNT